MKKLQLIFIGLLVGSSVFAQKDAQLLNSNLNLKAPSLIDFYNKVVTAHERDISEIDYTGSPYWDENFYKGSIITPDSLLYSGLMLRFNNFKDIFEFKRENSIYEISYNFKISQLKIKDQVYEAHLYHTKEGTKLGYFERLIAGKTKLYRKKFVEFEKAKPAHGYQGAKVPNFKKVSPKYYIGFEGQQEVQIIKNKKELISLLSKKKNADIGMFIRKNKLNPKNEDDLLQIVNYYNGM